MSIFGFGRTLRDFVAVVESLFCLDKRAGNPCLITLRSGSLCSKDAARAVGPQRCVSGLLRCSRMTWPA